MKERNQQPSAGFSLPLLLSFNELAWIAIFAMAVFCTLAADQIKKQKLALASNADAALTVGGLKNEVAGSKAEKTQLERKLAEAERAGIQLQQRLSESEDKGRLLAEMREAVMKLEHQREELLAAADRPQEALSKANGELAALKKSIPPNLAQIVADWERFTGKPATPTINDQAKERRLAEFSIRQELIGINANDLRRVIILFDTSSSMRASTAWEDAKRLVRVWLNYLPIEECVLVNFDTSVNKYPATGYLKLRDGAGDVIAENHKQLMARFEAIQGGSLTDTLSALKTAYSYADATMILLFSDGAPRTRFKTYAQLKPAIFDLIRKSSSKIPINTIGLGDYEAVDIDDARAGVNIKLRFLKEVARATGGHFIAR